MHIRHLRDSDYQAIISVLNDWWGGRQMADKLSRFFFQHFENTSFLVEEEGERVGFLVGFFSQSRPHEAYIHFVGVHPERRTQGVARQLYQRFEEKVLESADQVTIRCVTSPVNRRSIAFHQRMGFTIEPGPVVQDGVSIHPDYDGEHEDRVLFRKVVSKK